MTQSLPDNSTPNSLTGLLLPLSDRILLVPNVVVAELISYRPPQPREGAPDWLLGTLAWRDLQLPLLSFERASGGSLQIGGEARVAVLNTLDGGGGLKFIALLVQGIPRSLRVDDELQRALVPLAPLELDAVQLVEGVAKIPDLQALERLLG